MVSQCSCVLGILVDRLPLIHPPGRPSVLYHSLVNKPNVVSFEHHIQLVSALHNRMEILVPTVNPALRHTIADDTHPGRNVQRTQHSAVFSVHYAVTDLLIATTNRTFPTQFFC